MLKIAAAAMVLVGAMSSSFAQEYCDQVRQGIAKYGYKAARQYAIEHYTPEQVEAADACVVKLKLRHEASVE
jgi:hypothetical protein